MQRFTPTRRRAHVLRYVQDPELIARLRLAHTLWLLGYPEEADRQHDFALAAVNDRLTRRVPESETAGRIA